MASGSDPPNGGLTLNIYNNIRSWTWNSAGGYWTDGSGNHVYLIASHGAANGDFAWMLDQPTTYPNNPYGTATSLLNKVVTLGTRNADGSVLYSGSNYVFALKKSGSVFVVDAVAA